MWQMLSFYGRWDPGFFEGLPVSQHLDKQSMIKKKAIHAADRAKAKLTLPRKARGMSASKVPWPYQLTLVPGNGPLSF